MYFIKILKILWWSHSKMWKTAKQQARDCVTKCREAALKLVKPAGTFLFYSIRICAKLWKNVILFYSFLSEL